jgi:hypothetical protein
VHFAHFALADVREQAAENAKTKTFNTEHQKLKDIEARENANRQARQERRERQRVFNQSVDETVIGSSVPVGLGLATG